MQRILRNPTPFTVKEDAWGYIVSPAEDDLPEAAPFRNQFAVVNNLEHPVYVKVPGYVERFDGVASQQGKYPVDADSSVIFVWKGDPKNPQQFSFECWVGDTGYRARAKSDPRANPKG